MDIKFCSYNCCSLKNNIDVIRELTGRGIDLIFLQESFIVDNDLHVIDYVDEDYKGLGVAATYSAKSIESSSGRPMGGLVCLYKTNSISKIKMIKFTEDIMIVRISFGNLEIVFVNIYIRSDLGDPDTHASYLNSLYQLDSFLIDIDYDNIFIVGDFNADPNGSRSWENLNNFITRNHFKCFDREKLNNDSFTHLSYGHGSCKWLDHVIGRTMNNVSVKDIYILYDLIGSDHLPIVCQVMIDTLFSCDSGRIGNSGNDDSYIDWESLTNVEINRISMDAFELQGNFIDMFDSNCTLGCANNNCLDRISELYKSIVSSVEIASVEYRRKKVKKNKFRVIPGWNRNIKAFYENARFHYFNWLNNGKPRDHYSFDTMKISRSEFKQKLKYCKDNVNEQMLLSIHEKFKDNDVKDFWKEVRKRKGNVNSVDVIDGIIDPGEVVNIFNLKFLSENIIGEDVDENCRQLIESNWNKLPHLNLCLSTQTLKTLIRGVNDGCGYDGIHSNLLKNASDNFLNNICHLLNLCFSHCSLPSDLLKGDVTPVIKDKKGNRFQSDNYRPVMQSSYLLKLCESHLLNYLEEVLHFDSKQFGFVHNSSTSDACFLLKETVKKYINKKDPLYASFIDLSKAFDLVDHKILLTKLINRNIPVDIVCFLKNYLRSQSARVVWNNCKGDYFGISRGVRQGGILSPILFKLYVDDVIKHLTTLDIGCRFGLSRVNTIAYADDIVLLAENKHNINILYSEFCNEISSLNLKINIEKTKVMLFYEGNSNQPINSVLLGGNSFDVVKEFKYLGNMIYFNLSDESDVKLKLDNFYSSFYSFFRSFNGLDFNSFIHLFTSFCTPDYGIQLWNSPYIFNKNIFRTFEIAYSNSLKKVLGCPKYASTHLTAEICDKLLLKHSVCVSQARYLLRFLSSKNEIFMLNRTIFKNGLFFKYVCEHFYKEYNIDVIDNPIRCIIARINWVQRHEPRGRFCPYFNR